MPRAVMVSAMGKVFIVESCRGLVRELGRVGYECECGLAPEALHRDFDVVVLDSETEVCAELRALRPQTAILFVSDREAAIAAFEAGADDFLARPCNVRELVLRIEAVQRRLRAASDPICAIGGMRIDAAAGRALGLTPRALELLRYLYANRGQVVTQAALLRDVWRYQSTNTRTIDVHMAMLRQKLESNPAHPRHLVTVRGQGYLFVDVAARSAA